MRERMEKKKRRRKRNGIPTGSERRSSSVRLEKTVVEVTRFKSVGKQLGGMVSSINDIPLVGGASTLIKLFTSKRSTLVVVSRNLSIDLVTVSRKKERKEKIGNEYLSIFSGEDGNYVVHKTTRNTGAPYRERVSSQ